MTSAYAETYRELLRLHSNNHDGAAQSMAREVYANPHIGLPLRTSCCVVLGSAREGDYLSFAKEAVRLATRASVEMPNSTSGQYVLAETQAVLQRAGEDHANEQLDVAVQIDGGTTEARMISGPEDDMQGDDVGESKGSMIHDHNAVEDGHGDGGDIHGHHKT